MIEIDIIGYKKFTFEYLVLDYNGTLSADGKLLPGVTEKLRELAGKINIYVITADTFGNVAKELRGLPVTLEIIPQENQLQFKADFVKSLGSDNVFAIGNGFNDAEMLEAAGIGVALIQKEGAARKATESADILSYSIVCSLSYLLYPKRLIATLRR